MKVNFGKIWGTNNNNTYNYNNDNYYYFRYSAKSHRSRTMQLIYKAKNLTKNNLFSGYYSKWANFPIKVSNVTTDKNNTVSLL